MLLLPIRVGNGVPEAFVSVQLRVRRAWDHTLQFSTIAGNGFALLASRLKLSGNAHGVGLLSAWHIYASGVVYLRKGRAKTWDRWSSNGTNGFMCLLHKLNISRLGGFTFIRLYSPTTRSPQCLQGERAVAD